MKATTRSARPPKATDVVGALPAADEEPALTAGDAAFGAVLGIPVDIQVVLGSATMPVAQLMRLNRGAVIPLNHRIGELVDVLVNGRVVARGEIVVVDDDSSRFGVSLTEIVSNTTGG